MLAFGRRDLRRTMSVGRTAARISDFLETQLERDRERIGLWLPVALGAGIGLWFWLPTTRLWAGLMLSLVAIALAGVLIGRHRHLGRAIVIAALVMAAGVVLVWARAVSVDAPVLARAVTTAFSARVERAEPLPARGQIRLLVRPVARADLPPRLRLTVSDMGGRPYLAGEAIAVRARLMPPPTASVPGGYDFSRRAWFDGIGAVGTVIGDVGRLPSRGGAGPDLRTQLSQHVQSRVDGSAGGIAAAFVTGDRGAISDEDAEAMRRSGLAHLLSISGLHVTAVVGFAMLVLMRILALHQRLGLSGFVPLLAAAGAALAGVGYTLLTGAEVPTIRSCVAALLVLAAFMLGREALTLRLVAAGALIVMLWRPESLAGPSFQLSFAAVTAIVALHESRFMRRFLARRGEGWLLRAGRGLAGLLLTGIAVEIVLAPIALFHFHKAGLYGAFANIVAIPLTTFIVMPAEALGLTFDVVGLGAPFWWVTETALTLLIALAHAVAAAPGAVAMMPGFPTTGFALTIFGGLWLLLWQTGWRWAGVAPLVAGVMLLLVQPAPDLLVTGDGKHIAAAMGDGRYALLRDRAGDYVRDTMGEAAGTDMPFVPITDLPNSECNRDFCRWEQAVRNGGYTILASRGDVAVDIGELASACASADIVISDRWLPQNCRARWLVVDRGSLAETGGLALYLGDRTIARTLRARDDHPWRTPQQLSGNDEAVPTADLAP